MTNLNHVSAQDISAKWSKVTQTEAASIKNTDSLSAQVQKSYGVGLGLVEAVALLHLSREAIGVLDRCRLGLGDLRPLGRDVLS